MFKVIAHPTDFSEDSALAFYHALALALRHGSRLDILHVRPPRSQAAFDGFPHVREALARWGLLEASAPHDQIERKLGIVVRKVEIGHDSAVAGVANFLDEHSPDLVVLASHGSQGLAPWTAGSVAEGIARRTRTPTLFIGPQARAFMDISTGAISLDTVVVPVAAQPSVQRALQTVRALLGHRSPADVRLIHFGEQPPVIRNEDGTNAHISALPGPIVEGIIHEVNASEAALIAMATAGHDGFLDALRGSTTERVLHLAPCPLLAVPEKL